jgi:hypothetical protein
VRAQLQVQVPALQQQSVQVEARQQAEYSTSVQDADLPWVLRAGLFLAPVLQALPWEQAVIHQVYHWYLRRMYPDRLQRREALPP